MIREHYLGALQFLDLRPCGMKTRTALGLKGRQLARLAAGTTAPSAMLVRLLEALIALKTR